MHRVTYHEEIPGQEGVQIFGQDEDPTTGACMSYEVIADGEMRGRIEFTEYMTEAALLAILQDRFQANHDRQACDNTEDTIAATEAALLAVGRLGATDGDESWEERVEPGESQDKPSQPH